MKDWKAEYDKLRGENAELRKQLEYERNLREQNYYREREFRNNFKQLLIDVLGANT